jgi:hypothetical protein
VITATDRAPSRFSWSVNSRPATRRIRITVKNEGSTPFGNGMSSLEKGPDEASRPGTSIVVNDIENEPPGIGTFRMTAVDSIPENPSRRACIARCAACVSEGRPTSKRLLVTTDPGR